MFTLNMFLWRTAENYHRIVIRYSSLINLCMPEFTLINTMHFTNHSVRVVVVIVFMMFVSLVRSFVMQSKMIF